MGLGIGRRQKTQKLWAHPCSRACRALPRAAAVRFPAVFPLAREHRGLRLEGGVCASPAHLRRALQPGARASTWVGSTRLLAERGVRRVLGGEED